MYSTVNGMGLFGLNAFLIYVEVEIAQGVPYFDIVGLGDTVVRESKIRIQSAIRSSGLTVTPSRVTVNLAPADTKKTGASADLAVAVALAKAYGCFIPEDSAFMDAVFLGELALSGEVRGINGVLPMVLEARRLGKKRAFVPAENAYEASSAEGMEIFGVKCLNDIFDHFNGPACLTVQPPYRVPDEDWLSQTDFADVRGQGVAKWGLEVAAAGGHNVLLIGSPGSGKSMLAKRMPSILPSMTFEESIATTTVHSVTGLLSKERPLVTVRPFRAPHHTISTAGLAGGGSIPKPGEISLAHNGLLFLDELAEFSRSTLEILRQPMEEHSVTISRASGSVTYPCDFILIAAMNPCPCGYFGSPNRKCTCSQRQVSQYLSKVSGPLLDRFDLHIEVNPVDFASLSSTQKGESSEVIRERVQRAREVQKTRFKGTAIPSNARIPGGQVQEWCELEPEARTFLGVVFERMNLSARAYDRILKVARTMADLAGLAHINKECITKAVQYRSLDRKYWA